MVKIFIILSLTFYSFEIDLSYKKNKTNLKQNVKKTTINETLKKPIKIYFPEQKILESRNGNLHHGNTFLLSVGNDLGKILTFGMQTDDANIKMKIVKYFAKCYRNEKNLRAIKLICHDHLNRLLN